MDTPHREGKRKTSWEDRPGDRKSSTRGRDLPDIWQAVKAWSQTETQNGREWDGEDAAEQFKCAKTSRGVSRSEGMTAQKLIKRKPSWRGRGLISSRKRVPIVLWWPQRSSS